MVNELEETAVLTQTFPYPVNVVLLSVGVAAVVTTEISFEFTEVETPLVDRTT